MTDGDRLIRSRHRILERRSAECSAGFSKAIAVSRREPPTPLAPREEYDEARDLWQARVNKAWRFYFTITDNTYHIEDVIPHPK